MTLLERLDDVTGLAQEADKLESAKSWAQMVHKRAAQLQTDAATLKAEHARARVLLEANVPLSLPPSPIVALEAYRSVTVDDPAKGDPEFRRLVKAIERTLKTLTQAVDKGIEIARQRIVEQKQGAGSLESLAKVAGFEVRVREVLQILVNLADKNWKQADADTLRGLLDLRTQVLEQIDQLQIEKVSEGVRAFFKVARGEGANLEQLTDEVRSFLRERGLLDQIRIVLR